MIISKVIIIFWTLAITQMGYKNLTLVCEKEYNAEKQ